MKTYQGMTHGRGDFDKAPENRRRTIREIVHQQRVLRGCTVGENREGSQAEHEGSLRHCDTVECLHYEEREILSEI